MGETQIHRADQEPPEESLHQPTVFYFVRHGETVLGSQGRVQGQIDTPLTEKGEQQARDIADLLIGLPLKAIYASDLIRSRRTAEIIAERFGMPVVADRRLRERNFGQFEGKPSEDVIQAWGTLAHLPKEEHLIARMGDDVESDAELITRNRSFLNDVAARHPGESIIVVSHMGPMHALLVASGYEYNAIGHIGFTSYYSLRMKGDALTIGDVHAIPLNTT